MIRCVEEGDGEHYADEGQFIPSTRQSHWKEAMHSWGEGWVVVGVG